MVDSLWGILADIKEELEIATADTADDAYLNTKITKVNRFIDNLISSHATTLPITTSLSEALKDAAIAAVSAKYRRRNKEIDIANAYQAEFDRLIDSVIQRFRADSESRSLRVPVVKAYATEPLASDS